MAAFHADLITMFVIMVPLYLMYEISIWVALIFGKKRVPEAEELPATEPDKEEKAVEPVAASTDQWREP